MSAKIDGLCGNCGGTGRIVLSNGEDRGECTSCTPREVGSDDYPGLRSEWPGFENNAAFAEALEKWAKRGKPNNSQEKAMNILSNDYQKAREVDDRGLFAVQMSDGGWTIADGPGTALCEPDEVELAGYHVPIRFETEEQAVAAIEFGPDAWFDISAESDWTRHCVAVGGAVCDAYASKENRKHQ